jgi:hypothetical protein
MLLLSILPILIFLLINKLISRESLNIHISFILQFNLNHLPENYQIFIINKFFNFINHFINLRVLIILFNYFSFKNHLNGQFFIYFNYLLLKFF